MISSGRTSSGRGPIGYYNLVDYNMEDRSTAPVAATNGTPQGAAFNRYLLALGVLPLLGDSER